MEESFLHGYYGFSMRKHLPQRHREIYAATKRIEIFPAKHVLSRVEGTRRRKVRSQKLPTLGDLVREYPNPQNPPCKALNAGNGLDLMADSNRPSTPRRHEHQIGGFL
jgi:hypothetical protein